MRHRELSGPRRTVLTRRPYSPHKNDARFRSAPALLQQPTPPQTPRGSGEKKRKKRFKDKDVGDPGRDSPDRDSPDLLRDASILVEHPPPSPDRFSQTGRSSSSSGGGGRQSALDQLRGSSSTSFGRRVQQENQQQPNFVEEMRTSQHRAMDTQSARLKLEKQMPDFVMGTTPNAVDTPGFGVATPGFASVSGSAVGSRVGSVMGSRVNTPGFFGTAPPGAGGGGISSSSQPGSTIPMSPWMVGAVATTPGGVAGAPATILEDEELAGVDEVPEGNFLNVGTLGGSSSLPPAESPASVVSESVLLPPGGVVESLTISFDQNSPTSRAIVAAARGDSEGSRTGGQPFLNAGSPVSSSGASPSSPENSPKNKTPAPDEEEDRDPIASFSSNMNFNTTSSSFTSPSPHDVPPPPHNVEQERFYHPNDTVQYWSYSRNRWQPGKIIRVVEPNWIYLVDKNLKNFVAEIWVGELLSKREVSRTRVLKLLDSVLLEASVRKKIVRDDFSSDSSEDEKAPGGIGETRNGGMAGTKWRNGGDEDGSSSSSDEDG